MSHARGMCHSISKCQLKCGIFLHESHYMSNSTSCISNDMHFIFMQVFACQMSKTCKNFVKTYTLTITSQILTTLDLLTHLVEGPK